MGYEINTFCIPLQGYYFDQAFYHRLANPNGNNPEQALSYFITDEFKGIWKESELSLYPNPSSGSVLISNVVVGSEIVLMDLSGQILKQQKAENSTLNFNLENIAPGIYLIRSTNKEQKITQKIIIY